MRRHRVVAPRRGIADDAADQAGVARADAVVALQVHLRQGGDVNAVHPVVGQAAHQLRVQAVNAFDDEQLLVGERHGRTGLAAARAEVVARQLDAVAGAQLDDLVVEQRQVEGVETLEI